MHQNQLQNEPGYKWEIASLFCVLTILFVIIVNSDLDPYGGLGKCIGATRGGKNLTLYYWIPLWSYWFIEFVPCRELRYYNIDTRGDKNSALRTTIILFILLDPHGGSRGCVGIRWNKSEFDIALFVVIVISSFVVLLGMCGKWGHAWAPRGGIIC